MKKREPWTLYDFEGNYVRKMTPYEIYKAKVLLKPSDIGLSAAEERDRQITVTHHVD